MVKKTAKLILENKVILSEMIYASSILDISKGLMFASKKKVEKGMCLVIPTRKNLKLSSSVTMLFCFMPYEILFVDKEFKVIDKVVLKPFRLSYIPKKPCKYVIESVVGTFDKIKIGDNVRIEMN